MCHCNTQIHTRHQKFGVQVYGYPQGLDAEHLDHEYCNVLY